MPVEARPLFRPDIVRRHAAAFELPASTGDSARRLEEWAELLAGEEIRSRTESNLLPPFIADFFGKLLGYTEIPDERGRYSLSQQQHLEVDGKFADAVLGVFDASGDSRFVVALEGKGPKDPLDRPYAGRRLSAVEQAYRYATNLPCDWILVTNIREVRLYHKSSNQRTFERFDMLSVCRDENELRRFAFILSADNVIEGEGPGHLPRLLEASRSADRELTSSYYNEYAEIRRELVQDVIVQNPEVPPTQVLTAVQKILDRVLFCAFAEDRGLLPPETLKQAFEHRDPYNPRPVWDNFLGLFRAVDQGQPALNISRYNGGLFAEDGLVDRDLALTDRSCSFFRTLGDYDYRAPDQVTDADAPDGGVVDVDVLGHIFEQSITELEELQTELETRQDSDRGKRLGRRRREGVFYTAEYITRYVVEHSLSPVLRDRFDRLKAEHQSAAARGTKKVLGEPSSYDVEQLSRAQRAALTRFWEGWYEQLKSVRIVDPACGSGAFLLAAFDRLYGEYEEVRERLEELRENQLGLFDPDREILRNNLFGVDISPEAIEICRLSIWTRTAQPGKLLTDLDHNFRVGNSIVRDAEFDGRAFDWEATFPEVFVEGGFDVVIGNPPYVRQELLREIKPYLRREYETFHSSADLYVYFYELASRITKKGGFLSFIVTNKWLKASYAEPLRGYFARSVWLREILDFGHARNIFPDADVLPVVIVAEVPNSDAEIPEDVSVCVIPRDELKLDDLPLEVERRTFQSARSDFGSDPWFLDIPDVGELMHRIEGCGIPLSEWVGAAPSWGIKTGFNEAFLIDGETRESLISDDPSCVDVIRPYLRGMDIGRWRPSWDGLWMIVLKSSENFDWPWSGDERTSEEAFKSSLPSIHRHMKRYEDRLRKRSDQGRYWWELRSCSYWAQFEQPKTVYQEIQFHPAFALDDAGMLANNKVFFIPSADPFLLGVLNSPLIWWHNWRYLQHMKDEALSPAAYKMAALPIPDSPTDEVREGISSSVRAVVNSWREVRGASDSILDWLRLELGVEKPGSRLSTAWELSSDGFVEEVKKRLRGRSKLSSATLARLRSEYDVSVLPLKDKLLEIDSFEAQISGLVFDAYGLTASDRALVWNTAPPRMPVREPSSS